MKKFSILAFFVLSFSVCSSKRDILRSVPVLMEYKLFYPDEALERGLEGKAVVSLTVTEDGEAENVRVYQTSGNHLLDSAAVRTAKTFVFSPATLRDRPVKSTIVMPVEFRLRGIHFEAWITEIKILQQRIERSYNKENIEELYNLYKKLIYSTRAGKAIDINDYIKAAVLDSTSKLWDGYWSLYPASSILFIDIIHRYPDSFASLRARADFNKFIKEERIKIHNIIPSPKSDTLISRLQKAVKD